MSAVSLPSWLRAGIPKIETYVEYELRRGETLAAPRSAGDIRFERVTPENVGAVADFRGEGVVDSFRAMLQNGYIGVYAFAGDLPVAHGWAAIARGKGHRVWGYMTVASDVACIYFCSVRPEFRGRKIYQNLLVDLVDRVFSLPEIKRITIYADISNTPSLAAIQRVGFRRPRTVVVLSWLRRRSRIACYAGVGRGGSQAPGTWLN